MIAKQTELCPECTSTSWSNDDDSIHTIGIELMKGGGSANE